MSNLCLGVMDSGMGGLTVVDLLHKKYPEIKIVFLGDNANMPYGDKTKQQIMEFVKNNISFLSTFSIDGFFPIIYTPEIPVLSPVLDISR